MTTTSGASYKPMDEQGTHAANAPAEGQTTTGGTLPELANLTDMVRVMIQDRERREREISEERRRREQEWEEDHRHTELQRQESEHTIAEMRRQMERLQGLFMEHSVATWGCSTAESIKLTKLTDEDDIESYLTTFERIMAANEVSRERWSFQLAPQLTGKAQQAHAALPPEDAKDYDSVKEAILRRYDINEETYRQRFRKLRPREGESP